MKSRNIASEYKTSQWGSASLLPESENCSFHPSQWTRIHLCQQGPALGTSSTFQGRHLGATSCSYNLAACKTISNMESLPNTKILYYKILPKRARMYMEACFCSRITSSETENDPHAHTRHSLKMSHPYSLMKKAETYSKGRKMSRYILCYI